MPEIFKDAQDLERKFNQHGHAVQRQLLTKVVKGVGEIIRAKAEELAPRDTGALAESELVRVIASESSAAEVVARIGPDRSKFYGLFQEFGTVFHPPQPFLKPALEKTEAETLRLAGEIIGRGLEAIG